MADDHARDALLDRLQAELAAQQQQIAAQQTRLARLERPHHRLPHRRWRGQFLPLALVALLVLLTPLSLLAASPFNDLTGGVHDGNIGLIYDAGITKGCVPNVSYCPTDNVTRQEMASFLARTAGLGDNPPVANAKTAQTATSATTAQSAVTAQTAANATNATNATNAAHATLADTTITATNAGNATTVGGLAPSGLLRVARADDGTQGASVVTMGTSYATYVTLRITAPQSGFVLVTGQAMLQHSGNTQNGALVRVRNTANNQVSPRVGPYLFDGADVVGLSWVFPVTTGAQMFVLEGQANAAYGIGGAALTGLFVPFGYNGGTTLAP